MARTTTLKTGGISVDTSDFAAFARDLRRAAPALNRSLRTKLRDAGDLVADDARARASYSKKIPGTIRTRVSGASVTVSPAAGVALAGLEELGNKGASPSSSTFRHPAWGRWNVKDPARLNQRRRPYLAPAIASKGDEAAEIVFEALDDAINVAVGGA